MAPQEDVPPSPGFRKRRSLRFLVWLCPLAAAAATAFYLHDLYERDGPLISIEFADASGLRSGDTPVRHRGIRIGKVVGVELSADKSRTSVEVRLDRADSAFAADGAAFWIVSPQISEQGFGGLNTLFSGPYIDSVPGRGKAAARFTGSQGPPETEEGLHLVLRAPRFKDLRAGTPVAFRGVQVGVVRDIRLSKSSEFVEARILIWKRYEALVRTHSHFWIDDGVDVKGGLFRGLEVKIDSLRKLVFGEIAFATPDKDMGAPADDDARFDLEQPRKEWLAWSPRIAIEPAGERMEEPSGLPTGRDLLDSKLK